MHINVYNKGTLVEAVETSGGFVVLSDEAGNIRWEIEKSARERISDRLSGKKTGGPLLLRLVGGSVPSVDLVTRKWDLFVNDVKCEDGIYIKLPCRYAKVSLSYSGYTFEIPNEQYTYAQDVILPRPSRKWQK